jgi:hypothetical protein
VIQNVSLDVFEPILMGIVAFSVMTPVQFRVPSAFWAVTVLAILSLGIPCLSTSFRLINNPSAPESTRALAPTFFDPTVISTGTKIRDSSVDLVITAGISAATLVVGLGSLKQNPSHTSLSASSVPPLFLPSSMP